MEDFANVPEITQEENVINVTGHGLLAESLKVIRHDYEDQKVSGDSGDISITVSDNGRVFQLRYDLKYSIIDGKLIIADKSDPQQNEADGWEDK